jgi:hypothetical protein
LFSPAIIGLDQNFPAQGKELLTIPYVVIPILPPSEPPPIVQERNTRTSVAKLPDLRTSIPSDTGICTSLVNEANVVHDTDIRIAFLNPGVYKMSSTEDIESVANDNATDILNPCTSALPDCNPRTYIAVDHTDLGVYNICTYISGNNADHNQTLLSPIANDRTNRTSIPSDTDVRTYIANFPDLRTSVTGDADLFDVGRDRRTLVALDRNTCTSAAKFPDLRTSIADGDTDLGVYGIRTSIADNMDIRTSIVSDTDTRIRNPVANIKTICTDIPYENATLYNNSFTEAIARIFVADNDLFVVLDWSSRTSVATIHGTADNNLNLCIAAMDNDDIRPIAANNAIQPRIIQKRLHLFRLLHYQDEFFFPSFSSGSYISISLLLLPSSGSGGVKHKTEWYF